MPAAVQRPAQSRIQSLLERAIDAHKAGNIDEAKRLVYFVTETHIGILQAREHY